MDIETRLQHVEGLLTQMVETVSDVTAASSATYALNRTLLSSLVNFLKVQGNDMSLFILLFTETALEQADSFEGEKRRVFMAELGQWFEALKAVE